jgi:site-specific DNA recombinase
VTRAIAYARFSTDRQDEASIADQLRVCREYAGARGWTVEREFADEGISGAALGNRPGARAALEALGAGDVLLVNDLSRLSRSQDLAPLLTRLRHRGARVIGVQDGFDTESRTAAMQAGLSGIMSEEFRRVVADRTRSALEMRAREGRPAGGKAYGDAAIVREIFSRFAAGDTMKGIASDLNRRGIPSPGATWKARGGMGTRGCWMVSALHALLRNERYAGRVVWNRRRWIKNPDTGRRVSRLNPPEQWVVREIEPIVDAETWQKVQAKFTTHKQGFGGARKFPLSGLLECDVCGSKLVIVGGVKQRYGCGTYHAGGPHACANSTTVPRAIAEERILEPIIERLKSPEATAFALQLMRQERAAAEREPNPALAELRELERLVREGVLSAETAGPAIWQARRRAKQDAALGEVTVEEWQETVEELKGALSGADADATRAALGGLLGVIRCHPAPGGLVARVPTRHVLLRTGTGGTEDRFGGSGGVIWPSLFLPSCAAPRASGEAEEAL